MRPKYITNNWNRPQLVDEENHLYFVSRRTESATYHTCSQSKGLNCKGRAVVKKDPETNEELAFFTGSHNHSSSLAAVEAKVLDREAIQSALQDARAPPSRVLADSLNQAIPESVRFARRKTANLIRSMQDHRLQEKGHTKNPDSMEAIAKHPLPPKYQTTADGDRFLILKDYITGEDMSKCLLVFLSPLGKELLRSSHHWISDGTFSTCPKPFPDTGQIYIIYAELQSGKVTPCVFAILPDKSAATYQRMWDIVHQEVTSHGENNCAPRSIGMDFESSPAKEMLACFPTTQIEGCFFHWRKCLNDQLKKKHCYAFYNKDIKFHDLVLRCISLALVPLDKILDYFSILEDDFDDLEEELEEGAIEWFQYFTRTFVGRKQRVEHRIIKSGSSRKSPLYPHSCWNKYQQFLEGADTTTNKAEAYNGAWQIRANANPSFWDTLDAFKREEALAAQRWREQIVLVGNGPTSQLPGGGSSRDIEQREKISKIQNVLKTEGTIPHRRYLDAVASLLNKIPALNKV